LETLREISRCVRERERRETALLESSSSDCKSLRDTKWIVEASIGKSPQVGVRGELLPLAKRSIKSFRIRDPQGYTNRKVT